MDESSQLTYADVERIVALVEEGGFGRVHLETGGLTLDLVRAGYVEQAGAATPVQPPAPAPAPASAPAPAPAAVPQTGSATPVAARAATTSASGEAGSSTGGSADDGPVIVSPMLGIFYAAPDPESPPYVSVGQSVQPGTTVGLVEVMKMFTAVHAEVAGIVTAVLVENGQQVERGQALFRISEA